MPRWFASKPSVAVVVLLLIGVVGLFDWAIGRELSAFVLYFVPVGLAAWYLGYPGAAAASVLCAGSWFGTDSWTHSWHGSHALAVANTLFRIVAFLAIGWPIQRLRQLLDSERQKTELLRHTLAELKILQGILPICAVCKKIRDQEGHWVQLEQYITVHSDAAFSHGYCPLCAKQLMEESGLQDPHST